MTSPSPWRSLGDKLAALLGDAIDAATRKTKAVVIVEDTAAPYPPPRNPALATAYHARYVAVVAATRVEVLELIERGALSEHDGDALLECLAAMEDDADA
jgi:hypothetical protein